MMQLSNNVMVLNVGDQLPAITNDAVKIYMAGTEDLNPANEHWQDKFPQGMVSLTEGPSAISVFKNKNWIFINPMMQPQMNPIPSTDNPEWINKKDWEMGMLNACDGIFFNFLKKSVSALPLFYFGMLLNSNKMVVRCSEEYFQYSTISYMCNRHSVPLLPQSSNIKDGIWALYSLIPALQVNQKLQLPE